MFHAYCAFALSEGEILNKGTDQADSADSVSPVHLATGLFVHRPTIRCPIKRGCELTHLDMDKTKTANA